MSIELQNIDCNCNDCLFMTRDLDRFNQSVADHHRWALMYFEAVRANLYAKADDWVRRGHPEKANPLRKEADKMVFQFSKKEIAIQYGDCSKKKEQVQFIPNTCQLHTQECFINRKT